MPSAEQLRSRLLKKLSELFQLDQPDLDFGFYRIMHTKAQEVQDFIGTDLLKIVTDAFGDVDEAQKAELQAAYEKSIQTAKDFGAPNPEETEPVKKAKAALDAVKDTASAEADVYDHLYRFFERYYDDGDFISRRYYSRETSGKAAPFAVPYNGEEVKLVWANMDQYYIKSAEYFSNFTFDLRQAKEVRAAEGGLEIGDASPLKVHFKIVEATEGEHGNVKASEATKRFFIIHKEKPVEINEAGELVVNFEYRPDPEKTGQEGSWRDKRNTEAVETIIKALEEYDPQITQIDADEKTKKEICENLRKSADEYLRLFKVLAPTDKDKNRPVLAKYVNQYTARNTMDYFIHKDLGGFLRRELDFYIKNEVMRLDDIENADAPAVESYLAKIKVLRKIAGKLIDFLAQLEDFQKKLWLKKKFVIETNYCITLDRVPEELYPEITANEAQIDEWVKLFAIDEIEADLHSQEFSQPLTVDFLKINNKLVLDTRFFDDCFKARLVASIENFDEQCDGLLIHSENFQALNLLQERYREQVKYIYIDPPYNKGYDGFIYKDTYQHSTWLSMIYDRLTFNDVYLMDSGVLSVSIDDDEDSRLITVLDSLCGRENLIGHLIWDRNHSAQAGYFKIYHEYICNYAKSKPDLSIALSGEGVIEAGAMKKPSKRHKLQEFAFPAGTKIDAKDGTEYKGRWGGAEFVELVSGRMIAENGRLKYPVTLKAAWTQYGQMTRFFNSEEVTDTKGQKIIEFFFTSTGKLKYRKERGFDVPSSVQKFGTASQSTNTLANIIGFGINQTPKPVQLNKFFTQYYCDDDDFVLDYFAGSGTTAHAVINLNREDGGKRKYILVEMGDYFDTVLKPRIAKVVYSESWKDGKPTARDTGISHCFKYIRLESYEDTLNNLRLNDEPAKSPLLKNPSLKEDYMLRYLLDVETRGSQSLLNIDAFADPTAYTLEVKKPGTDEYVTRAVDLIETFNYLIGLRVEHYGMPQTFTATFKRIKDPELPEDQHTKLVVDGRIRQIEDGPWWFRKVEGWVPADPANPNNGQREKVLIVWRKLTDDIEQDNLMLDEWFQKNRISTRDFEFDTIYVNGSNNLPNLKQDDENWKVRLIEEEFMKRMWDVEGV